MPSKIFCLASATMLVTSGAAYANNNQNTGGPGIPCGSYSGPKRVSESAAPGVNGAWVIHLSGEGGANDQIGAPLVTGSGNAGGSVTFTFGNTYNGRLICDADNESVPVPPGGGGGGGGGVQGPNPPGHPGDPNPFPQPNPNPPLPPGYGVGAVSFLNIESMVYDPLTGLWSYEGVFDRIAFTYPGRAVALQIPDLFADTNGDGTIGAGDILYSWINVRQFIANPAVFSLGDRFNIVDGEVAELDGMWFSATPIYFDPILGPRPSGGVWFNSTSFAERAFSSTSSSDGNSVALTAHTFETGTPEPAVWSMLIVGFGLVGGSMRRRRIRSAY